MKITETNCLSLKLIANKKKRTNQLENLFKYKKKYAIKFTDKKIERKRER